MKLQKLLLGLALALPFTIDCAGLTIDQKDQIVRWSLYPVAAVTGHTVQNTLTKIIMKHRNTNLPLCIAATCATHMLVQKVVNTLASRSIIAWDLMHRGALYNLMCAYKMGCIYSLRNVLSQEMLCLFLGQMATGLTLPT